jgi:hypothetical protein
MPSVRPTRRRRTLGAAAALALAVLSSCGEDSKTGLSQQRASDLRSSLDQVETRVNDGNCTGAAEQAATFRQQVDSLPSRVDRDLRDALERSATRLETLVAEQCEAQPAEPPAQEPTVTDENSGDQQGKGKKDKKPKEQKGTTGQEGSTGVTGQEGSTGVTGPDGGVLVPEGGG